MAVKASAEVTLYDHTDATALVQWYQLTASATAPSAPATTDASATPSGWTQAEPAFDPAQGTRYLYACLQTVWGDGTCDWGSVQLSSSYEQAKQAWNRANAAQGAAAEALADGVEYVVGTQTAATNAWKGATRDAGLEAGKTIAYMLPFAGNSSAATLELALSGGGTTGAKAVKMVYSTSSNTGALANVTTHWPVGSVIHMTYDGTQWLVSNYNTNVNQVDRTQYAVALAASAAISAARVAVLGTDGKLHTLNSSPLDVTCPPLYVATAYTSANVTAGTTRASNYSYWGSAFNLTNTHAVEGAAAGRAVYVAGTMAGNVLTPTSTVITCTEPTEADGLVYMRLGRMSTAANAVLEAEHPLYAFVGGSFQQVQRGALQKALETEQSADALTLRFTEVDGAFETVNEALDGKAAASDLANLDNSTVKVDDERMAWLSVTSEGNVPSLVLGNSTTSFHSRLTNSALGFYEGSTELTRISGTDGLAAPRATVSDELRVGPWALIPQANGVLALKYIG